MLSTCSGMAPHDFGRLPRPETTESLARWGHDRLVLNGGQAAKSGLGVGRVSAFVPRPRFNALFY